MQESAPDQTTSKFIGRPVAEDSLPYEKRRQVFDIGNRIMQREYKRAELTLDYRIDLMGWLDPDENITAISAWVEGGSLVITRLEFTQHSLVIWLAAGDDGGRQTVYIDVTTSKQRRHMFVFTVVTEGTSPTIVTVSLTGPGEVLIGYQHPDKEPEPFPVPEITVTPTELAFPITFVDAVSEPLVLVMENTGEVPVYLRAITATPPFFQKNRTEEILLPGSTTDINITFQPEEVGEFTGGITIDINDGGKQYATFTAESADGTRIRTSGNQFVGGDGKPVRLRSINWFGAETEFYAPHGLWARSYRDIIDQIKAMGFNCIRLPFSGDTLTEDQGIPAGAISYELNPDLAGKAAMDVLDALISYLSEQDMYVVLDHHRVTAGEGADGSPISDTYTLQNWIDNWLTLATRYAENPHVLGADLHNEPHALTWQVWAEYAEQCGNAIHNVAPDWIIFVEGVATHAGDTYWPGGQLAGVETRPIQLAKPNRLAYAPHDFGQSSGQHAWLAYAGQAVPQGWPTNLYGVWRKYWGFIHEQQIAPVWLGAFGGKFGVNGEGVTGVEPNAEYESQWMYHLSNYLNGDYDGDGTVAVEEGSEGISFAYWAFNPNIANTGGIVQDDWTTPQALKLRLLDSIMAGIPLDYLTSLNPISATEIADGDLLLVNHNGSDFSIRVSEFMTLTRNKTYEVGTVHWFAQSVDPNAKYIGQTWVRVDAPSKTIRIAKTDDSDLLQQGGSDTVTVARENLPAEPLAVTGTAADTDLGTKTTEAAGAHSNPGMYSNQNPSLDGGASNFRLLNTTAPMADEGLIQATPDHAHAIVLGAHGHPVSGATENMGSGAALNVANAYVTLSAWYRVS